MTIYKVKSIKEPRVVEARSLTTAKGRKEAGLFILYGLEQLRWAIERGALVRSLFIADSVSEQAELTSLQLPIYQCSEGVLKKISDTNYLTPILAVAEQKRKPWQPTCNPLVVLDGVVDFGNIGTIIRSAAAFGIDEIVATAAQSDLYQRKIIDASRGACLACKYQAYSSPQEAALHLKEMGYQIAVTTPYDSKLQTLADVGHKPIAVVFGSESTGVSDEMAALADMRLKIPMCGEMESLNVGVAAGISLYEMKVKVVMMSLIEKIKSSLGRNLSCTLRWSRKLFDEKLQQATGLTCDEAIMLMILKCDTTSTLRKLSSDSGVPLEIAAKSIDHLIERKIIDKTAETISLSYQGDQLLTQVALVQEEVENILFKGFSVDEKETIHTFLQRMQTNCSQQTDYV